MAYKSSHTMGTKEMIDAMIAELPERYEMELIPSDMEALIYALAAPIGFAPIPECDEPCNGDCCVADRVTSLFSGIAETLNIEGI